MAILAFQIEDDSGKYLLLKHVDALVLGRPSALPCSVAMVPHLVVVLCKFLFYTDNSMLLGHFCSCSGIGIYCVSFISFMHY